MNKTKTKDKTNYKRLTWTNRVQIEALYNSGFGAKYIAEKLGFHISSIYYELHKGYYMHRNSDWTESKKYSAYKAQRSADFEKTTKCPPLKIDSDHNLLKFIEDKILNEKLSPGAVLGQIKKEKIQFKTSICKATLYSYIDKGIFLHVTNKNLIVKGKKRKNYKKVRTVKKYLSVKQ